MSKPWIHAESSARKFGGKPEDYLPIHELLDASKSITADNRHRLFTHNSWFLSVIIPKIFGEVFQNSEGKTISSREIAEQHVLEDFGGRFIPTASDVLESLDTPSWLIVPGLAPPSLRKLMDAKEGGKVTRSD